MRAGLDGRAFAPVDRDQGGQPGGRGQQVRDPPGPDQGDQPPAPAGLARRIALTAQGFGFHKVDFLYAAALPGRRFDPAATRAQALRRGLEAVRRGIGHEAFLLGCGSPFGPAVGIVDAMRVSPDVTDRWEPRAPLPGLEEAASCARNAIVTSRRRAPLHRRLWVNDNDCLLLRPVQTELDPFQRHLLAGTIAGAGGFTMASDDLSLYGEEEWKLLDTVRAAGAAADGPLELVDPFAPTLVVRSSARTPLTYQSLR